MNGFRYYPYIIFHKVVIAGFECAYLHYHIYFGRAVEDSSARLVDLHVRSVRSQWESDYCTDLDARAAKIVCAFSYPDGIDANRGEAELFRFRAEFTNLVSSGLGL